MAAVGIRGPNPILEKVFNVVSLHIRTDSIVAADNEVLHPKDSPEAAELKKKGTWNRKFFYAKTQKTVIAPEVWHDLVVEVSVGEHVGRWVVLAAFEFLESLAKSLPLLVIRVQGGRRGEDGLDPLPEDEELADEHLAAGVPQPGSKEVWVKGPPVH
jgi:hypothetical protein